jgi:hypothetical protein
MRNGRTLCARTLAVCLGLVVGIAVGATASTLDRFGVREATLSWEEPDGVIDGYIVFTSRDGGPFRVDGHALDNRYTIAGEFYEEVVVKVRALGRVTAGGPLVVSADSDPSPPIRFLPAVALSSSSAAIMHSDTSDDLRLYAFRDGSTYPHPGRAAPWQPVAAGFFTGRPLLEVLWRHEQSGAIEVAPIATPDVTVAASDASELFDQELRGVGDLDGDGDHDLLMHDRARDRLRKWSATSNGSIRSATVVDGLDGAEVVGVDDFGADGTDDIWMQSATNGRLEVFRANGSSSPIASAPLADLGRIDRVADFDGDGSPDLLWRTPSSGFAISYLRANGTTDHNDAFEDTVLDPFLDVVAVLPLLGGNGVALVNRRDGSLWVLFTFSGARIKILDSDGQGFAPFSTFF